MRKGWKNMDCEIIEDLMPLVLDECCSEKTAEAVREHIESCAECRRAFERMSAKGEGFTAPSPAPKTPGKVREWKASLMQSLALFASFALIIIGVSFEAASPEGTANGAWLFGLIIPATAFMLSLANLYFVRHYRSRRAFRIASCALTAAFAAAAFIWGVFHYGVPSAVKAGTLSHALVWGLAAGFVLTAVFCAVSFMLSGVYAKAIGKE